MSKLGRLWDWLAPGLTCLSPMGAFASHDAGIEKEAPPDESKSAQRRALVPHAHTRPAGIPLAHL
jgi:hypothetical protein